MQLRTLVALKEKTYFEEFVFPELKALLKLFGGPGPSEAFKTEFQLMKKPLPAKHHEFQREAFANHPYVFVDGVSDDQCQKIMERSISIKAFLRVLVDVTSWKEFKEKMRESEIIREYGEREEIRYKLVFESHLKSLKYFSLFPSPFHFVLPSTETKSRTKSWIC